MKEIRKVGDKASKEIRILYGEAVTVLPMKAADAADRASGIDCKILMCLAADPSARVGDGDSLARFADRIGCSLGEVERAVAYWSDAGVLRVEELASEIKTVGRPRKKTAEETVREEMQKRGITPEKTAEAPAEQEDATKGKKPRRSEELPSYTLEELTTLLESKKNLSLFVDECQRAYGKIFNPREVSRILALVEYYSLEEEYVLTLLRYYGEMPAEERKSLGYIIKKADALIDAGIETVEALSARLNAERALKDTEGQIRTVFGLGTRAFTAKERAAVLRWVGEFECSMELIRLAYDRTVNATGKPSIPYAAKILERWHVEGLKTPEDVQASEDGRATSSGGNFDTDDFFEAALKRSYGEDYEKLFKNPGTDGQ